MYTYLTGYDACVAASRQWTYTTDFIHHFVLTIAQNRRNKKNTHNLVILYKKANH